MADELANIANISWVDEDALRQDVAARVAAQSSTAALQDEEKLKKAWKAFEDAEKKLAAVQEALEEVERQRAERANGLQVVTTTAGKGVEGSSPPPPPPEQQIGRLQFQLKTATRDMDKQLAALQRTQSEVEQRKQERLEHAKAQARREARAEEAVFAKEQAARRQRQQGGGNDTEGAPAVTAARGLARTLPPTTAAGAPRTPRPVRRGGAAGSAAPLPTPTAPPVRAAARRIPDSFPLEASRAVTMTEYSGGEVLPSLNRVQVTRSDLKARHLRYDDDTDMEKFLARLGKRRRLEMVEALQRHRLEHPELYSQSERNAVKREASHDEGAVAVNAAADADAARRNGRAGRRAGRKAEGRVKLEDDATNGSTTQRKDRGDDADDELANVSSPTLARARYEMDETSQPGFEDEAVIDVDAMMEEEEDMSLALLKSLLKEEKTKTEVDDDGSGVPTTKQEEDAEDKPSTRRRSGRKANARDTREGKKRGRHGDGDHSSDDDNDMDLSTEEIERLYHNLALPPEPEVSLLPGIHIHAAVYDKLLDYQQEGLLWLVHLHAQRCGGILGDEMGLGKTVQIAALLNALHHSRQLRGPALIVTPMTVLQQWVAELHRWAPHLRVCVMHESSHHSSTGTGSTTHNSPATSRAALMASVRGTPAVVVTTYTAMRLNCVQLHEGGFQYVILDEGHKISNPEAGITLAAKSFTTPHRLILSGSPIQNRLKELWCLFDFVKPGLLGTMNRFVEEFEAPIGRSKSIRATPVALASAVECAKALQAQIAPYLLRRLKKQVNTILPKKFERVIRVPLSDEQLELYVELVASTPVQQLIGNTLYQPTIWGGRLNRDGRDSTGSLHVAGRRHSLMPGNQRHYNTGVRLEAFRVMNQLRQICNHADLFRVVRGEDEDYQLVASPTGGTRRATKRASSSATAAGSGGGGGYRCFRSNNPVNIDGSSKLRVLLEMVREWKTHGHRALIFTQTRMMLDIIENLVEQEGYRYIRMDGTTQGGHRQELMDRFNEDESIFVALLTTRVGGIGVNLIGADRVVIFDPDWNPVTDVQARERAWRIGQTRDVCVYRLITSGTVEEAILRRQLSKTYVTDKVLKDPNLQRFFHQQENLVESFFLGSEYDSRVPQGRKHVLVAQEMIALPLADSAGGEQERALEEDDDNGAPARHHNKDGTPAPDATGTVKKEREFGQLLRVVTAEDDGFENVIDVDENDDNNNSPRGGRVASPSASVAARRAGAARPGSAPDDGCETGLLKNLLDGQDVSVSGSDSAAQRLARVMAEQKMQRVASQGPQRSLAEQNKEFSLTLASERHVAKEKADREEQRRYAEEEAKKQLRRQNGW